MLRRVGCGGLVIQLMASAHAAAVAAPTSPSVCNAAFIPGTPGGFTEKGSQTGCCVLQQALDLAWTFQSLLYCSDVGPVGSGKRAGQGCSSAQAVRVTRQLQHCCQLVRPFWHGCHIHSRLPLQAVAALRKTMVKCAESHGHGEGGGPQPLLPGLLAADKRVPVRFPETSACMAAAVDAVRAFQAVLVLAHTTYSWTFDHDVTHIGKRFRAICDANDTPMVCARNIVSFFRDELHSKMWPVGLSYKDLA